MPIVLPVSAVITNVEHLGYTAVESDEMMDDGPHQEVNAMVQQCANCIKLLDLDRASSEFQTQMLTCLELETVRAQVFASLSYHTELVTLTKEFAKDQVPSYDQMS